jgi:hypothetical protein
VAGCQDAARSAIAQMTAGAAICKREGVGSARVPVVALVLRCRGLGVPRAWAVPGLWLAARVALPGRRGRAGFSARTRPGCVGRGAWAGGSMCG